MAAVSDGVALRVVPMGPFNDVRFGDAQGNEYKIRRRNIVEGVSCDIDVLVPLNLNTAQNVYLYFGNETASG